MAGKGGTSVKPKSLLCNNPLITLNSPITGFGRPLLPPTSKHCDLFSFHGTLWKVLSLENGNEMAEVQLCCNVCLSTWHFFPFLSKIRTETHSNVLLGEKKLYSLLTLIREGQPVTQKTTV